MITSVNTIEIQQLAPMPASVARLALLVADPKSEINEIARVIEFDEALTANVLKVANSVQSASITPITTIREAIIRLGAGQILKIAVGRQTNSSLSQSFPEYQLEEHELWRHSVASALAAENISAFSSVKIPGVAFTAALLHDIGKLLIRRHLNSDVLQTIQILINERDLTWFEAEYRVLGTTHAEVGGTIARYWKFPDELIYAIENHHNPDLKTSEIYDTVHIANTVAKTIGVGLGVEQMNLYASTEAAKRLGLSPADFEALCAKVKDELASAEEIMRG
jgi:putative nucleotidyltransferase with HDIG domain